ncbi:GIY-YIG nuclease family protein [Coralloluteibacterium stylophorae]|uniref:GIY-YIG nuclease family protein n=1 Tax=Coralloluteibacterium stylophorae TaxID=1776034 RepID=A0A8J8AZD8_9GAMM|nr:GIY-YIG nuclease family protein [Coralloluteibacterium stylophorae]
MSNHPQTIQIFLPSGDPQGIRVAEITTRIVRVVEVPRRLMGAFLAMPESDQVGVYFLFGEDEASGREQAYIGQTGLLRQRLSTHNTSKDFWSRAVVAVSLTQNLTNTHAIYLEWCSIQQAQEAGRYQLHNGTAGGRPHTPAPMEADCREIHDTLRTLLATLGYPIFEPLRKPPQSAAVQELRYYCRGPDTEGIAEYTTEGLVVLTGSTGRLETVASFPERSRLMREDLLRQGVISIRGTQIRFETDHLFRSPSAASTVLLGRPSNGWDHWKDAAGRSLDTVERQMAQAEAAGRGVEARQA